jgi:hypothetical protein
MTTDPDPRLDPRVLKRFARIVGMTDEQMSNFIRLTQQEAAAVVAFVEAAIALDEAQARADKRRQVSSATGDVDRDRRESEPSLSHFRFDCEHPAQY